LPSIAIRPKTSTKKIETISEPLALRKKKESWQERERFAVIKRK